MQPEESTFPDAFSSRGYSVFPWPEDLHHCIFLGRAHRELEVLVPNAIDLLVEAIGSRSIHLRARLLGVGENILGDVRATANTPEGWRECIASGQYTIFTRDRRPWVPVSQRRAIPQHHWLFVTRKSWQSFLLTKALLASSAQEESRAIVHLASILEKQPALSKAEAQKACEQFHLGARAFLRVWPKARHEARLPILAPAGRKKKSTRKSTRKSTH